VSPLKKDGNPKKVTMRDVAKAANVSQSTVSRILNPSSSKPKIPISEETKEKVLAVVKELGYQPNLYAQSLRGKNSRMIGMLIADISNPFYHPMVRAVQDVAIQHHYNVMIANSDHLRDKELLFCEAVLRRPLDGIIIIPYNLSDDELHNLKVRTGMAISAVGNHIQHPEIDVTYADDTKASYEAVRWLIEHKGHRRIAMICANFEFPVIVRRLGAYRQAMEDAGLPIPPEYVIEGDWSIESGRRAIKILMNLPEPPTAVFAAADTIAIGALETAEEMNYKIPGDVAIIGFDDIPAASWVRPRLTTVAQNPAEMGTFMAKALFQRIQGEYDGPGRRYEIPLHFIERESA
jgi:LacI family transcriptional regulator